MQQRVIFFDFDGVISDSFAAAYAANRALCPHLSEEEYRQRFDGNINQFRAVASQHGEACRTDVSFWDVYTPLIRQAQAFPGMVEVVRKLAQEHRIVVVTSSLNHLVQEAAQKFGIAECITEILGTDVHESKYVKITEALKAHDVSAQSCVMVTDTYGDIHEAQRASVRSVGVTWGYQDREALARGERVVIVDTPAELLVTLTGGTGSW
ncbi:MAG: HAD family hydrolase [Patescibacteria group bacterium]